MSASWYRHDAARDVLEIRVHVQPGARRTQVAGLYGDALKIQVAAPPVDDKANERLLAFLAQVFAVPRRQVSLKAGARGRSKIVEIVGSRRLPDTLVCET